MENRKIFHFNDFLKYSHIKEGNPDEGSEEVNSELDLTNAFSILEILSGFKEIKEGDKNSDSIPLLQLVLRDLGIFKSESGPSKDGVDGKFGKITGDALEKILGKRTFNYEEDGKSLLAEIQSKGSSSFKKTLEDWAMVRNSLSKVSVTKNGRSIKINGIPSDSFGATIGITDKIYDTNYSVNPKKLNLPEAGPIGDIEKSAWANLNVSTRGITNTQGGGLGCAAAVSIIFYRATGISIMKNRKNPIELGTASLWIDFTSDLFSPKNPSGRWELIKNWKNDSKPGDIILTSKGAQAGHVGVVVQSPEGYKIISNSSKGFEGDKKGQIELNYSSVASWESVARKNPYQTASFRYKGKYLKTWKGDPSLKPEGENDQSAIEKNIEIPNIIIKDPVYLPSSVKSPENYSYSGVPGNPDLAQIPEIKPSEIEEKGGSMDLIGSIIKKEGEEENLA